MERNLADLFDKMTGIDDFSKFNFEPLMPWSNEIPEYIKKKQDIIPIKMTKIFIRIFYI